MSESIEFRRVEIERVPGGLLLRVIPDTNDCGVLAAACDYAAANLRLLSEEGMANGGQRVGLQDAAEELPTNILAQARRRAKS